MKIFEPLYEKAKRHNINPHTFVAVYLLTIPLFTLSFKWTIEGTNKGEDIIFRLIITWMLFQAPSLYILVMGENMSIHFELGFRIITLLISYYKLGIEGVFIAFLGICCVDICKIRQRRKKLPKVVIKQIDPFQWLNDIAQKFQRDYKAHPFNEDKRCPVCIPDDDFSKDGTHSNECALHQIPTCEYWSFKRVESYLLRASAFSDFVVMGAFVNDQLVGFVWGYLIHLEGCESFYIDVIDIDPQYRINRNSLYGAVTTFVLLLKLKFHPRKYSLWDLLVEWLGNIPVGQLYLGIIAIIPSDVGCIATRTHQSAIKVMRLLQVAGFRTVVPDKDAPTRIFFKVKLKI